LNGHLRASLLLSSLLVLRAILVETVLAGDRTRWRFASKGPLWAEDKKLPRTAVDSAVERVEIAKAFGIGDAGYGLAGMLLDGVAGQADMAPDGEPVLTGLLVGGGDDPMAEADRLVAAAARLSGGLRADGELVGALAAEQSHVGAHCRWPQDKKRARRTPR